MSDIFREVDEAMQQEKLLKIWNEYRSTIILSIIILLVSSAATSFYYKWKSDKNAEQTQKLTTALQAEKPEEALLQILPETKSSHKVIALMTTANLALQEGKTQEAANLYKQVIDTKSAPRNMRDLARIFYVQNADTASMDILKPVLANKKSPWLWQAKIEAAVMAAHKEKDFTKALSHLDGIDQQDLLPFSLKERGQALHHLYTIKATEQKSGEEE